MQKIEINPGNDAVVHHCNMGFVKVTDLRREEFHPEKTFITGYVPGGDTMKLDSGIGFCIPAGSVVGLELHSVPNGEATTDQTSVGFVFAKENMFGFLFFTRDDEALNLAVDPETGHVIEN